MIQLIDTKPIDQIIWSIFPNIQKKYFMVSYLKRLVALLALALFFHQTLFAEGTKQIRPNENDKGYLILDNQWSPFATYDCPSETRLMISICNPDEKVYFGFNQGNGDVKFRIKDPNNNIVFAEQNVPQNGTGFIDNHSKAIAGPSTIVGASGYDPFVFTPATTGDYYIEFTNVGSRRDFELFDITVASSSNVAIKGRIWSKSWMFSTRSFDNVFEGKMFIYADDGIVTSIDFNGMQPFVFVLSANKSGTQKTGNTFEDRKSTQGRQTYPQYKIFLTEPDVACYPTGTFGNLTKPVTITGCGSKRCINVTVDKAGDVEILLDLALPKGYQPNTRDRILPATVKPGDNCIEWDSKDGLGNLMKAGESVPLEVNYFNGLTHMPLFDVEGNKNGYIVDLIRPSGPRPRLFWDDTKIGPSSPPNNLNLAGCSSVAGCHTWLWAGSDNGGTDYGNTNTINTWWYANIINANANYVIQDVAVDANITNPLNAPNDTTVCATITTVQLFGGVFGASGGKWSGGTNNFAPNISTLAAIYTPSQAEKTTGKVKLTLTSNPIDDCPAVSDTMRIFFTPAPKAIPGADQILCKNITTVSLAGNVTNATGGKWTGGLGNYTPDANTLTTIYKPTAAEKNGVVNLTLSTVGSGVCAAASAPLKITFIDGPTVNLGKDTIICASNPTISLKPNLTTATKGIWTGGTGTFNPDRNTANATYKATSAEVTAGTVTLTFSTTDNGNCTAGTDNLLITFSDGALANAGADKSICVNNASIKLSGSISGAPKGIWTGGEGNFAPSATTLTATYTPTLAEIGSGKLTLFLTSTGSNCLEDKDTLDITFTPAPTVKAGADKNVCENNVGTALNAIVTGATGVEWKGGSGVFVPNHLTPITSYTSSKAEIDAKVAALVVTTTGNGNCSPAADTILILIAPAPTVDITSAPKVACANNPIFDITATTTNAQSGKWSGGVGIISPKTDTINIKYTATPQEVINGSVKLIYTAQKGGCLAVIDTINLTFKAAPVLDAGPNLTACINNPKVILKGNISPSTPVLWSGGAGNFAPANNITTTYTANAGETAGIVKIFVTTVPNDNCKPVKDSLQISFSPSPTINAGADLAACNNNPIIKLLGTKDNVAGGVIWSGGLGNYSPNANDIAASYTPTIAELTSGAVTLTLTTTANGNCAPATDNMKISFTQGPKANAGADITTCADNAVTILNGSVTIATGGIWSGGKGTFSPNVNTLKATYTPTLAEIQSGKVILVLTTTGNGDCNPHSDEVVINITPAPVANAGSDQTVCEQTGTLKLNGIVNNSAGGQWSTLGTGTFTPSTITLAANYQPSAADIGKKEVQLVLTTTGNPNCKVYSDTLLVSFTVTPKIVAGPNQTICTNDLPIALKANGSAGKWVNGNGSFSPDRNTLNAIYTPTAAEISSGSLQLTFTTNPQGSCPSVSDKVTFTIPQGPKANAGIDQTLCANVNTISLTGTITNATSGFWTSNGTGSFVTSNNALQTSYKTSLADQAVGKITFVFTTLGNNLCSSDSDQVLVTITPEVKVDAGPNETICADVKAIALKGTTTSSSAIWTSTGTGTFIPNNTTLGATYQPSLADTANGTVTLTLATPTSGNCPAVIAKKIVTITDAPTVNAGPDMSICADGGNAKLDGKLTIATAGRWTTKGTGAFSPNAANLAATYFPSAADTVAGKVTLKLTSDGNGTCNAVSDSLIVTITPKPILNIGNDISICADETDLNLSATVAHASGVAWSSTGNGIFNPNNLQKNTIYKITPQEVTKGLLVLTATTTGNGLCKAIEKKITANIVPIATVAVGGNQTICADADGVKLSGKITIASGGVWTSTGSGKFISDITKLDAVYVPSAADTVSKNVSLTLTTTGNGLCKAKSAITKITIVPKPLVNPGSDFTVCEDTSAIALQGKVTHAAGGIWTTDGSGNFFPNNQTLLAKYVPSANDKKAGQIKFTLTTTGVGTCSAVNKSISVSILAAPTASIGNDTVICENTPLIPLRSTVNNGGASRWTSSGTGKFSPDSLAKNPNYIPSTADRKAGLVFLTFHANGVGSCKPVKLLQKIRLTPLPTINAGSDATVCATENSVNLKAVAKNTISTKWTSTGTGVFTSSDDSLAANYLFSTADKLLPKINLIINGQGTSGCGSIVDTLSIFITPIPTIQVGADQKVCADATETTVNATVSNAIGMVWKSNTSGSFSPANNAKSSSYQINNADKVNKTITITGTTTGSGVCAAVSDELVITITPAPTANAGVDKSICADAEFIDLKALVTVASGGKWTTSGNGTFAPIDTNLTTSYFPSLSDKAIGNITLSLTTTGNGNCKPISDDLKITITPAPSLDAGPKQTVCPDVTTIPLNPTLKIATGVKWITAGTGTFSPNNNTTFANYVPSAADVAKGNIMLQVISTGNGLCNSITDDIEIAFNSVAPINAGADVTLCNTDLPIALDGSGTTGIWSGGAGIFSPNVNTLNATYAPTAAEIALGKLKLKLTSGTSGTCPPSSDEVEFTINQGPTVAAGNDVALCEKANSIALLGTVGLAGGGVWETSGTGAFADKNNLNTTYTLSNADKKNGNLLITLVTTGNGICKAVKDDLALSIVPTPIADAGTDLTVCADANSINLTGTFKNTSNATWAALPSGGSFSNTTMNPAFTPSTADKASGLVKIILTANANTPCPSITDTMQIFITPQPTVAVNANGDVCADTNGIALIGSVTVAGGGKWTTTGTGTFSPSEFALNAQYILSENDKKTNKITSTLTTINNGNCAAQSKSFDLIITPAPIVNAGGDMQTCADKPIINLKATIANAGGVLWKAKENGTFNLDNTQLNTAYNLTKNDIAASLATFEVTSTGNGKCKAVKDFVNVVVAPKPSAQVNAGFDQIVCANNKSILLNGVITAASGGIWKTLGTGTFQPSLTTLEAGYTPSATDTANKKVAVVLTTTGNGLCDAVTDTMLVSLIPAPRLIINPAVTVCADSSRIALSGLVFNSAGASWSTSGNGFFSPSITDLKGNYIIAPNDIVAGKIGVTLTTSDAEVCPPISASTIITITPKPTISLPIDLLVCSNIDVIDLLAEKTTAKGIVWKTFGDGNFDPDAQSIQTNYLVAATDVVIGAVKITATTTGNGSCKPVTDDMIIKFVPAPELSAGPDITACADTTTITLMGSVSNATATIWKTLGSGLFNNVNILAAKYTPSEADKKGGKVKLVITATGNTNCANTSDTILITLQRLATIALQAPKICPDEKGAQLGAVLTNATTGNWSSAGSGAFSPNAFALDARYFPTPTEILAGKSTLTFTASATGVCPNVSASTDLQTIPPPRANAGPDQTICRNASTNLFAITNSNQTYRWQTITGTVISNNQATVVITVSQAAKFVLTTTDIGGCTSNDTLQIDVIDPPTFNMADRFCLSDTLMINSNPSNLPPVNGLFQWARNNANIDGETKPIIFPADAGKYRILYSFESCTAKDTTIVSAPPSLITINRFGCLKDQVTLETSVISNAIYEWTKKNTLVGKTNPLNTATIADTSFYVVKVTDVLGCFTLDSARVIGIPKPILNLKDITSCTNDNLVLRAKPINFPTINKYKTNYSWSKDNVLLAEKSDSLKVLFAGLYITTATVEVCTTVDTSNVILNPVPAGIKSKRAQFCSETDRTVMIDGNNGQPLITYVWQKSKKITAKDTVNAEGYYSVILTNQFNCKLRDSVFVKDDCPPVVYVPNAFTPGANNGDKGFLVFGRNFTNFEILVFSRWGEVIFKTKDRTEIWDGTYRGEPMPIGVYPYLINYEGDSEKYKGPYKTEGTITIVR